jgi:hypothetical protein
VASKSAQHEPEKAEVIEEALDVVDKLLDRVKVLYEQFFLGIQKQPPAHLHSDVERKLRDLAQLQIRNTALRYRFATLQQKYGSYHTYWRRTLREIEAGRYHRSLSRITRQAAASGAEIPQEILAAMPKRMREQVRRDRDAQRARELRRRGEAAPDAGDLVRDTLVDADAGDDAGFVHVPTDAGAQPLRAHVVDEADADLDLEALFRSVEPEELPLLPFEGAAPAVIEAPRAASKPPPVPSPSRPPPVPSPPKPPPIPGASAASRPPPGMTQAEVRALHARYVQAKQTLGQPPGPDSFGKLMKTIHAQAPKILAQYRAKGVEFSVAVKDGQVIIRAKPRM